MATAALATGLTAIVGCAPSGESGAANIATLEEAFSTVDSVSQAAVDRAIADLTAASTGEIESRRRHLLDALRTLEGLVAGDRPSPEQVRAIHQVWLQVQQTMQSTPGLEDQRLYEAQATLGQRLFDLMERH